MNMVYKYININFVVWKLQFIPAKCGNFASHVYEKSRLILKTFCLFFILLLLTSSNNLSVGYYISDNPHSAYPLMGFDIDTINNKYKACQFYDNFSWYSSIGYLKKLNKNTYLLSDIIPFTNLPIKVEEGIDTSRHDIKININIVHDKSDFKGSYDKIKIIINDTVKIPYKNEDIYYKGEIKSIYLKTNRKFSFKSEIFFPKKSSNLININFLHKHIYDNYYPLQDDTIMFVKKDKLLYFSSKEKFSNNKLHKSRNKELNKH